MQIEFPKKFDVEHIVGGIYHVEVPNEYVQPLTELLEVQSWIRRVQVLAVDDGKITVYCSKAYVFTAEEAHAAICKLAEHILDPLPDVDAEVWGEAFTDGCPMKGGE
jgi:hypothetical protein